MSLDRSLSTIFKLKSANSVALFSLFCLLFIYDVILIMNCSLEIDLSKELAAPLNHNVHKQVEAEINVRDLSSLFVLTWLLYHCGLMTWSISSVLLYSLSIGLFFGANRVHNTLYCFSTWFISFNFNWNDGQETGINRVKYRSAPTRREQEKWNRATKAATGGSVSNVFLFHLNSLPLRYSIALANCIYF